MIIGYLNTTTLQTVRSLCTDIISAIVSLLSAYGRCALALCTHLHCVCNDYSYCSYYSYYSYHKISLTFLIYLKITQKYLKQVTLTLWPWNWTLK